jgi:hypothetical protein
MLQVDKLVCLRMMLLLLLLLLEVQGLLRSTHVLLPV